MTTAADIVIAFNSVNEKRGWTCRAHSAPDKGLDLVHFHTPSGLIDLMYNAMTGKFSVKFKKFQASWGDYIRVISRSLYYVLTTFKASGLPFDAPLSPSGIVIHTTVGDDNEIYVSWSGMHMDPKFIL